MFPSFGVHPLFLVLLLVIVLIVFGPGKLPEVGAALGRGINEFKRATSDVAREIQKPAPTEPPAPTTAASEEPSKPSAT